MSCDPQTVGGHDPEDREAVGAEVTNSLHTEGQGDESCIPAQPPGATVDDAAAPGNDSDAPTAGDDNTNTAVTKADAKASHLHRLRPALALVHDGVDGVCHLIDQGSESIGRSITGVNENVVLAAAPQWYLPVQWGTMLGRGITKGVLGCVRGVNRGVQFVTNVGFDTFTDVPPATGGEDSSTHDVVAPQHGISLDAGIDHGVGVLNGVLGDYLEAKGNTLAMPMALRCGNIRLPNPATTAAIDAAITDLKGTTTDEDRKSFPRKIVVLVHGLTATELSWTVGAEAGLGAPDTHYGAMLHAATGHVPLYLRYNTGLTIKDNGEKFSKLLEALLLAWPSASGEDKEERGGVELVLVGHSMGGLVIRAASKVAMDTGASWPKSLRLVSCLGTPHAGAPFARFGESTVQMCNSIDLPATQIVGAIGDRRSAGIKDLCDGAQADTGPLLPSVSYFFAAGSLAPTALLADLPIIETLGDFMVPPSSAAGPTASASNGDDDAGGCPPRVSVKLFPGVSHVALQVNRDVYTELEIAVRESSA